MGGRSIHLSIYLRPAGEGLELPIHYNHIVQAALYRSIDSSLAAFLHEQGFLDGKRVFKLFAFSLLRGAYEIDRERGSIRFTDQIELVVSSPVDEFCQSLVNTLLTRGSMRLGEGEAEVEKRPHPGALPDCPLQHPAEAGRAQVHLLFPARGAGLRPADKQQPAEKVQGFLPDRASTGGGPGPGTG